MLEAAADGGVAKLLVVHLPALFCGNERGLAGGIDEVTECRRVQRSGRIGPCQTHDCIVLDVDGGHSRLFDDRDAAGLSMPEQQLVERGAVDLPNPGSALGQEGDFLSPINFPIVQRVRTLSFSPDVGTAVLLQEPAVHFLDQPQFCEKASGADQQRLADMEPREQLLFQ